MKLHLLSTFICIILESVVSDAALAPELYWKSKLPSTTIPKAVKDLLRAGKIWKTIYDDPNKQLFIWQHATNAQFYDDPNKQLFVWQHVTNDQFNDNPNKQLLFWCHVTNDILLPLLAWWHATNDQLHDDPNKQLLFWLHATNDQFHDNPNKQLFVWQHATNDQFHDDPNKQLLFWQHIINYQLLPLLVWWYATNDQLHGDPNKQLLFWQHATNDQFRDDPNKQLFVWQHTTNDQLHDNPNKQLSYWSTSTNQLHDGSSKYLFLSEDDLHPGKKLEMLCTKSPYSTILLPREVAETIPFSVEEVPELLKMFSIKPGSKEAHIIKSTIHHCEEPPMITGEEKHWVTSLESMIDYITSKLGINVKAYSTEVEKETHLQTYTIAPGVKKIWEEVMACHQTHYPYALFHCHKAGGSNRAYFVPLEGFDGTRVKAIAVCHLDTSDWDPNHLVFQVLKIKPGTAPVCHFSPTDNIIWTPNMVT